MNCALTIPVKQSLHVLSFFHLASKPVPAEVYKAFVLDRLLARTLGSHLSRFGSVKQAPRPISEIFWTPKKVN